MDIACRHYGTKWLLHRAIFLNRDHLARSVAVNENRESPDWTAVSYRDAISNCYAIRKKNAITDRNAVSDCDTISKCDCGEEYIAIAHCYTGACENVIADRDTISDCYSITNRDAVTSSDAIA